jgi:hypothetical protein
MTGTRLPVAATWVLAALTASAVHAATLVVDDGGPDCLQPTHATISAAVQAAKAGDRIVICPGTYAEQVVLTKKLTLAGRPSGSRTVVLRPTALPSTRPSLVSGNPVTAAIIVDTPSVAIEQIEIDMTANGVRGCSPIVAGVYARNSNGFVRSVTITGARHNERPACEGGVGLYLESNGAKAKLVTDHNVYVGYQKAAAVANGAGAYLTCNRSQATGAGPSSGPVQTAFQIALGARGRLRDVSAHGHASLVPGRVAPGILVRQGRINIRHATVADGQTGLFLAGDRGRFGSSTYQNLTDDGIVVLGTQNKSTGNLLDDLGVSGIYVDGDLNFVSGGSVSNTPVGIWFHAGLRNRWLGTDFSAVPEQVREGGTRTLDESAVVPFTTLCSTDADCDDADECTIDTCNPGTGLCTQAPRPNGTPCNDGNSCSSGDQCQSGVCTGTTLPDGTGCDDGLFCTSTDTCTGGSCGGAPRSCDDGNPCLLDTCDELADTCVHVALPDGSPCVDGTLCNGTETCVAGVCTPGITLGCDDSNVCTADSCNATLGCRNLPVLDGTPCSDANACNGAERCQLGVCRPGVPPSCTDNNPCTNDLCEALTGCQHLPVTSGTSCADTDPCDGAEVCQAGGVCAAGAPLNCSDGNACTTDGCGAGGCTHTPISGCTPCTTNANCNDGDACTTDVCTAGTCGMAPAACDDGNPCTNDTCNPGTGCAHANVPNGTGCTDFTVCDGNETCQAGACTPGTAPNCDDSNPCTADSCHWQNGCQHVPLANGSSCLNGTVCDGAESCQSGSCTAGTPLDCDDGNACTTDACNPLSGCTHTPIPGCVPCSVPADCADGNPCTTDACSAGSCSNTPVANGTGCDNGTVCDGAETCQAGACTAGSTLDCDDGNACTTDTCDAVGGCGHTAIPGCVPCTVDATCGDGDPCTADFCSTGTCQHTTHPNGTSCADGTVCNGAETCQAGTCTPGTPLVCNDGNACTTDSCDPSGGCQAVALADGTGCADGTVCNGAETCQSGVCTPGAPLTCADGNPCTNDACNALTGCQFPAGTDGTPCADGTVCNGAETCSGGSCTAGTPLTCDDSNPCTTDACDAVDGCQFTPLPPGTSCDDATVCNGAETCASGTCTAGTPLTCTDGDPCTADTCDPIAGCQFTPLPDGTPCGVGLTCVTGSCQ